MQRHIFTKKLFAWVLLLFAWQCCAADTTFKDMTQDELVKAVMNDQYGNTYNEELKCWLYKSQEGHRYCIVPVKSEMVNVKDGKRLYIITSNDLPRPNKPLSSKIDRPVPGLIGTFLLENNQATNDRWHYTAIAKEFDFYKNYCCLYSHDLSFQKISNHDDYVWLFTIGEIKKGINESRYVMLYPKNNRFLNISNIFERIKPEQNQINKIKMLPSKDECGFYSIELTKIVDYADHEDMGKTNAQPNGEIISKRVIKFNREQFLYTE